MTEPMAEEQRPQPPTYQPRQQFHPVARVRKWLHWLGIENEHGLFSWRASFLLVAVVLCVREPSPWTMALLVLALALHVIEGGRSQARTRIAMETAAAQASTRMSWEGQVAMKQLELAHLKEQERSDKEMDEIRKEQAVLREKVKLIATPERMEKLEQFFKKRLGV